MSEHKPRSVPCPRCGCWDDPKLISYLGYCRVCANAEIERLRTEITSLTARLADHDDAYAATMAEVCNDVAEEVEKHCTCVPFLRQEIKRLRAEIERLRSLPPKVVGSIIANGNIVWKAGEQP